MFYIFAPGPHTQNLGFSIIISIRPVYAIDLRFMYDRNRSEWKIGAISFLRRNSSSQKSEFRSREIFQVGKL